MINFRVSKPKSVNEAVLLLDKKEESNMLYAGGTDLLGLIKAKITSPSELVNLKGINELKHINYSDNNGLNIGALVTLRDLMDNSDVKNHYPVVFEALKKLASPQLRNMGTVGGNLCQRPRCWYFRGDFDCIRKGGGICYAYEGENKFHSIIGGGPCYIVHPSDLAVAFLALNAKISIAGAGKTRTINLADFFLLPDEDPTRENILGKNEILTEINLPPLGEGVWSSYFKFMERDAWEFAVVSVAAVIKGGKNNIESASFAFGGIAPIPWKDDQLDKRLSGVNLNEADITRYCSSIFTNVEPLALNGYKVPLVRNIVKKMLLNFAGI